MKPTNRYIVINGKKFFKQKDKKHLRHSLYICSETQQQVKVSWSAFWQKWCIEGAPNPSEIFNYFIHVKGLRSPIAMDEIKISTYFTDAQEKVMRDAIDCVLKEIM